MSNNLNRICAKALMETMEFDMLDEEDSLAIDTVSGDFGEEYDDRKVLHGGLKLEDTFKQKDNENKPGVLSKYIEEPEKMNEGAGSDLANGMKANAIATGVVGGLIASGYVIYKGVKYAKDKLFKKVSSKDIKNGSKLLSKSKDTKNKVSLSMDEIEKIEPMITKKVSSIVKEFNKTRKDDIKKEINEFFSDFDEDELQEYRRYIKSGTKLTCELFYGACDTDISYIICNEEQYVCCAVSDIISDIGKELKADKEVGKYIDAYGTGDGDEGCLYINLNGEACKEYLNGGN